MCFVEELELNLVMDSSLIAFMVVIRCWRKREALLEGESGGGETKDGSHFHMLN
jgi:hypothetical protein